MFLLEFFILNMSTQSSTKQKEKEIRAEWVVGSLVEVHSNSTSKWHTGAIMRIFTDAQGEWLEISYDVGNDNRLKQVSRDDHEIIRPAISNTTKINVKEFTIVSGYIRSNSRNVFSKDIIELCMFYFMNMIMEKWDQKNSCRMPFAKKVHLGIISICYTSCLYWKNAFMTAVVDNGFNHWSFKMCSLNYGNNELILGIWDTIKTKRIVTGKWFGADEIFGYGWDCKKAMLHGNSLFRSSYSRKYGDVISKGDIVHLFLDMNKLELTFGVNNKIFEKAFVVEQSKYVAAVSFHITTGHGAVMQFLTYRWLKFAPQDRSKWLM
eukprot:491575_1